MSKCKHQDKSNINGALISIAFEASTDAYIDFRLETVKSMTTQRHQLKIIFEEWHQRRIKAKTNLVLEDDQFIAIPQKKKYIDRRNAGRATDISRRKASKQTIRSLLQTIMPTSKSEPRE